MKTLEQANEIILIHVMLNDFSMKACHFLGLNGFKRLHERATCEYLKLHQELEKHAIDRFNTILKNDAQGFEYTPPTIKEHLTKWGARIEKDLGAMAKLNNEYTTITGVECTAIVCSIKTMAKSYKKINRLLKRFELADWDAHEIYSVDDKLHKKEKRK